MRQDIVFRGTTKSGLHILLPDEWDFETLCQRLQEKLQQHGRFFQGAEVTVKIGERSLADAESLTIASIMAEAGLNLRSVSDGGDPVAEAQAALKAVEQTRRSAATIPAAALLAESTTAMVVTRTLRSGQSVRHEGDVIVLGDVNPGAEIVASGHIVVMGALRGVAHAGCTGNTAAIVAAAKLQPTQLRIGQVIGRAPDAPQAVGQVPEVARVRDGIIVIESSKESNR